MTAEEPSEPVRRAQVRLAEGSGTVVIWEKLDRVLPERYVGTCGWGKPRMLSLVQKTTEHLAVVFRPIVSSRGGMTAASWSLASTERSSAGGILLPRVSRQRWSFLLRRSRWTPDRRSGRSSCDASSSLPEIVFPVLRLSTGCRAHSTGIANRVCTYIAVIAWSNSVGGMGCAASTNTPSSPAHRSIFGTDLDESFQINVAKMKVILPPSLRPMLEKPLHELCLRADEAYRNNTHQANSGHAAERKTVELADVGVALLAAAMEACASPCA